eukprot:9554-Heterococcus_DN1.PRE.12
MTLYQKGFSACAITVSSTVYALTYSHNSPQLCVATSTVASSANSYYYPNAVYNRMTHFGCLRVMSVVIFTTVYILLTASTQLVYTHSTNSRLAPPTWSINRAADPPNAYLTYMIAAALVQHLYVMELVVADVFDLVAVCHVCQAFKVAA